MRLRGWVIAVAAACVAAIAVAGFAESKSGSSPRLPITFPDLGYHYYPPRLPTGLARNEVVVVDMTNAGSVRPPNLRFASDGTLSGAHWTDWGAATSTAHGTATVRICSPNCGGGHDARYPATMVLSGVRTCGEHRYYERARVTLTTPQGPKPWGAFIRTGCS